MLGISSVRITATIEATQATRTFSVGIVLSGAQADRTYGLSTDQVLVTLGGTASALASLQGDELVVTADVDGLGAGTHLLTPQDDAAGRDHPHRREPAQGDGDDHVARAAHAVAVAVPVPVAASPAP